MQAGFSVIEALVAVAIMAVAMLPLASLQGQVSRTAAQQQHLQARFAAERSAMAVLRDANMMAAPSGAFDLGAEFTLHWNARPISRTVRTNSGEFDVALFAVEASVSDANAREIARFSIDQIGWRRVSEVNP